MRMGSVMLIALVVMLFAVVPVWLAVMSVVGIVLPWLFFGFIGWAAYTAIREPRPARFQRHSWPPPRMEATPRRAPVASPSPRPASVPPRGRELPIDVQVKVEQIRRK